MVARDSRGPRSTHSSTVTPKDTASTREGHHVRTATAPRRRHDVMERSRHHQDSTTTGAPQHNSGQHHNMCHDLSHASIATGHRQYREREKPHRLHSRHGGTDRDGITTAQQHDPATSQDPDRTTTTGLLFFKYRGGITTRSTLTASAWLS